MAQLLLLQPDVQLVLGGEVVVVLQLVEVEVEHQKLGLHVDGVLQVGHQLAVQARSQAWQ